MIAAETPMLLLVHHHLLSSLETTVTHNQNLLGDCGRWLGGGAKHITYYSSHFNN
jgi:hypothetical protein